MPVPATVLSLAPTLELGAHVVDDHLQLGNELEDIEDVVTELN
jgi:hypothetical protein